MIYLIDHGNRPAYLKQLEEMFRIRHDIYGGQRGWTALANPDGRDVDQFDTEDTIYLLGLDQMGRVYSGLRLNPTTGPHLINTVFPHAVSFEPIPVGDDIYEFTQYFVVSERVDRMKRRQVTGELLVGMFEYGLAIGLTQISLLCDSFFLNTALEMKWQIKPLGLPMKYEDRTCMAISFEVSHRIADNTREARGVHGPVLAYEPESPSFAANDNARLRIAASRRFSPAQIGTSVTLA